MVISSQNNEQKYGTKEDEQVLNLHNYFVCFLSKGTYDDWLAEMAGDRLIMERFANITDGSVIGIRAPYLRIGGNTQFQMMNDQFFVYDSSITAPLSRVPGLNLFIAYFLSIFPILWQLLVPIMRIITKDEHTIFRL